MNDSEEEHEMEVCIPPDISQMATEISLELLPRKSRHIYEQKYVQLMDWCTEEGVEKVSENVLLTYFSEKAKEFKPSSLWSVYSMLKTTLKIKNDLDISGFHKLTAFLKEKSVGYKPKKSKTLSQDNVSKFLLEAPDREFLMMKVILIFGIAGACRRDELVKMTTNDIKEEGSVLVVTVPNSETNKGRVFTIINDRESSPPLDYVGICKKYFKLRFEKTASDRLFLKYSKGICMNQAVGKNNIAKIPSDVANYLGLPEPSQYTGHCFRRTSATLLGNTGGDTTQQKRHGGWKRMTVADSHIDVSIKNKSATAPNISGKQNPATATADPQNVKILQKSDEVMLAGSGLVFQNCTNCTFNINIHKTT